MIQEFNAAKVTLGVEYHEIHAFNQRDKTFLIMDGFYQGLGYVIVQKRPGDSRYRVINCGSHFLTPAMLNYMEPLQFRVII